MISYDFKILNLSGLIGIKNILTVKPENSSTLPWNEKYPKVSILVFLGAHLIYKGNSNKKFCRDMSKINCKNAIPVRNGLCRQKSKTIETK